LVWMCIRIGLSPLSSTRLVELSLRESLRMSNVPSFLEKFNVEKVGLESSTYVVPFTVLWLIGGLGLRLAILRRRVT